MSEITEVLELVNRVADLAARAESQANRADNLASRNHRLQRECLEALGATGEEAHKEHQLRWGAGLEGSIKALIARGCWHCEDEKKPPEPEPEGQGARGAFTDAR